MVDVEFSTNYGEFFKKFSEAIAEAVKAMKKCAESFMNMVLKAIIGENFMECQ